VSGNYPESITVDGHLIPQPLYIALSPQGLPRCELHFEKTAILEPG